MTNLLLVLAAQAVVVTVAMVVTAMAFSSGRWLVKTAAITPGFGKICKWARRRSFRLHDDRAEGGRGGRERHVGDEAVSATPEFAELTRLHGRIALGGVVRIECTSDFPVTARRESACPSSDP